MLQNIFDKCAYTTRNPCPKSSVVGFEPYKRAQGMGGA